MNDERISQVLGVMHGQRGSIALLVAETLNSRRHVYNGGTLIPRRVRAR